jgi:Replication-relaxation
VRPGMDHLSALGHPDARLHLPRHHAIVSWSTPEGRQSPFVAETIPLRVDAERLALHAARQAERGGRYRTDLRQPHWDRERRGAHNGKPEGEEAGPDVAGRDARERNKPFPDSTQQIAPVQDHADNAPVQDRSLRVPVERTAPAQNESQRAAPQRTAPQRKTRERTATQPSSVGAADGGSVGQGAPPGTLPGAPPDSYRELVELDDAHSVRWAKAVLQPRSLVPEPLDLEILALVACMRHVLGSQIHRRFNSGRAVTTTQRRLKRLSDAGLVRRFQFHRRDGGGVPMCYAITATGLELLHAHDRLTTLEPSDVDTLPGPPSPAAPVEGDRLLRQARHDVHVTGWALALEHAVDGAPLRMRGAQESVLSPPLRSGTEGRAALGPSDLTLPGGRAPHEFMRTDPQGERVQVERFETVRPDVSIELPGALRERIAAQARARAPAAAAELGTIDLLVEFDDRLPTGRSAAKLERYDHLVAGWAVHTNRYGRRLGVPPVVVFVCRDRARARECARRADAVLTACRAYAGEYPVDWEYPGREGIIFVAERDAHEGFLRGYGVPRLSPDIRVSAAHGDPRARESVAEPRDLLTVTPTSE